MERPRPLPPGPVESYAERAALLGLGAAGMALPVTGNPRRAAALALTATPKAARVARAGSPRHPGPDITTRAATTATGTSAGRLVGRLTGRAKRARTVALVGAQLGQTVAIGGTSPAVLASSAGSAGVLAGIVQTPGLSQLFGCTAGPGGWAIAAAPPPVPPLYRVATGAVSGGAARVAIN
ncbi:MAG TPA: hypothetical protein VE673_00335 [Pseudonocardiaceae bacterium]|nr:hypothetical protein [Pseudonocardiaceae bacterium]